MKKIIFTAMIFIILSCSKEEEINDCGCIETQELLVNKKVWTGGAYLYTEEWQTTTNRNYIDGCYTTEESAYMVRQVSDRERWFITCR